MDDKTMKMTLISFIIVIVLLVAVFFVTQESGRLCTQLNKQIEELGCYALLNHTTYENMPFASGSISQGNGSNLSINTTS